MEEDLGRGMKGWVMIWIMMMLVWMIGKELTVIMIIDDYIVVLMNGRI